VALLAGFVRELDQLMTTPRTLSRGPTSNSGTPAPLPDDEQPLLGPTKEQKERWAVRYKDMNLEELHLKRGWTGHYDPNQLAWFFTTFRLTTGTVLMDSHIWKVVGALCLVAVCIATCVIFLLPDPHMLDTGKFETIVKYLKVFLAFMLGLFMNNSLTRWWQTVNTTTDYFNNVEKLLFMANAFGVPPNRRAEIIRYAIASCICLRTEGCQTWEKDENKIRDAWASTIDELLDDGYLLDDEVDVLLTIRPGDRAVCIWGWISAVLCVMFNQEDMKPMAMNRLTQQCQVAVDMVSQLKVQICIQLPFMYAHMMACMVHLNNVLVATNCGLGLGGSIADILHGSKATMRHASQHENTVNVATFEGAQSTIVYLVTLLFEPMLYQAFLQIGANFCYPFGVEDHHVPLHAMILDLETNLQQMCYVLDSAIRGVKEMPLTPKAQRVSEATTP
jgi:predicted membrane chloride channel (bestrophin family)